MTKKVENIVLLVKRVANLKINDYKTYSSG